MKWIANFAFFNFFLAVNSIAGQGWTADVICTSSLAKKSKHTYLVAEAMGSVKVNVVKEDDTEITKTRFDLIYLKLFINSIKDNKKIVLDLRNMVLSSGINEVFEDNDYWESTVNPVSLIRNHKIIKKISFDLSKYNFSPGLSSTVTTIKGNVYRMKCTTMDEKFI